MPAFILFKLLVTITPVKFLSERASVSVEEMLGMRDIALKRYRFTCHNFFSPLCEVRQSKIISCERVQFFLANDLLAR